MSVPGILETTVDTIPAEIPYLFADLALVAQWREKLEPGRGLKIGINWRGRPVTRNRDIPMECFRLLADLPGVCLISLQKGEGRADCPALFKVLHRSSISAIDFRRLRMVRSWTLPAAMMSLDLVITSDTSISHLAGALGVPVWVALPYVPDWRWLLDRNDSPWYPTMRLFRQKAIGDWKGVFDEIYDEVRNLIPRIR